MRLAKDSPTYVRRRLWSEIAFQLGSRSQLEYELGLAKLESHGRIPTRKIAVILQQRLASTDQWIRERTAIALSEVKISASMLEALSRALQDPQSAVRAYACEALGRSRLRNDVQKLLFKMLGDSNDEVKASALSALARLNASPSMERLRSVLRDRSSLVRLKAVEALQKVAATADTKVRRKARVALERQLRTETDGVVRCAALETLYMLSTAEPLLEALVAMTRDSSGIVRWRAYDALARVSTRGNVATVETALHAALKVERSRGAQRHLRCVLEHIGHGGHPGRR